MSRSRPKSARKDRAPAADRASVATAAPQRPTHYVLCPLDTGVLLGASLLLGADQAERLGEFQRWHASKPALCLTEARPIICPVFDRSGRPLLTRKGQPVTSRIILELAVRSGERPAHGACSARVLWFVIAWDERGQIAHMSTYRTRRAALALFNRPAERLALSAAGQLIERPAAQPLAAEGVRHA